MRIVGQRIVLYSKLLCTIGCLVAYMVIVKDNASSALMHLWQLMSTEDEEDDNTTTDSSYLSSLVEVGIVSNPHVTTIFVCTTIMLPLCLLRTVKPLERCSLFKITLGIAMVLIVVVLWYQSLLDDQQQVNNDELSRIEEDEDDYYSVFFDHWIAVKGGVVER